MDLMQRRRQLMRMGGDSYKGYIFGKAISGTVEVDDPLYGITPFFPMVYERYLKCAAFCEKAYRIVFYDDNFEAAASYPLYGNNVVDGVRTWRGSEAMATAKWCRFTFLLERIDDIYLRRDSSNKDFIFKGKNV